MTRDEEIKILLEKIVNICTISYYNPNGPDCAYCPFCYEETSLHRNMKDISHEQDCPYLLAKDLSTNLI